MGSAIIPKLTARCLANTSRLVPSTGDAKTDFKSPPYSGRGPVTPEEAEKRTDYGSDGRQQSLLPRRSTKLTPPPPEEGPKKVTLSASAATKQGALILLRKGGGLRR